MSCGEIADVLVRYLEGEFPWRQRTAFKRHPALCSACFACAKPYELTARFARMSKSPVDGSCAEGLPDKRVRLILNSRASHP